jgi:phosphatidylserine/phosphatidylglycerophosphate/cardiolipin synthase-like enzyme
MRNLSRRSSSQLYNETDFYPAFVADIRRASSVIIIESPFISQRRALYLLPELAGAVGRNVSVIINTRNPAEHDSNMRAQAESVMQTLQNIGARIYYTVRLHRKVAIIDQIVLWEGSLNILSQTDSSEIMRRIISRNQCKTMLQFLSIKRATISRSYEYIQRSRY